MFRFILYLLPIIVCFSISLSAQTYLHEARSVIQRFAGTEKINLQLTPIGKENGCDVFETSVRNGKLEIKGSSGVAICRGFYDFVKSNHAGISGWAGNRCDLPERLPEWEARRVVSPFQHHYYFNVVTYGYSMPYWDWYRWEKEIDWMSLHGIDMPLALVANEAITMRVFKKLGLTDQEIDSYFTGPAHLPWMRMGNISKLDSPLPSGWHEEQIKLQHRILKRMRALGMKPICPGFAGFIPPALKRLYPEIQIVETTWGGHFHNWMISPQEELFPEIGKMFIEEWEKEFGKNSYYLVDSFNEMEIPFPPSGTKERTDLLASYGEKVYESIKAGNPDAVWVIQGWMFGYQRNIWDYETLGALVSKVPDDKMLLLDLAVDYNKHFWRSEVNWEFYKGFYNKSWVYSVIPNMGGKTAPTGVLSFYANGHIDALKSANKGQLAGFGMAPEGIENNEVIYEMICDAGWRNGETDVHQWLQDYSLCRYGKEFPDMGKVWDGLCKSVYGSFTDHPRFNWQFRPGLVGNGSVKTNSDFYTTIEQMAENAPKWNNNQLFTNDFIELTAFYLGGKLELLSSNISKLYMYDRKDEASHLEKQFEEIALAMDRLLESHPVLRLQYWIDFARSHGNTKELKDYYERNARRLVTIWGPPVDDYSARIWSGLIRDYYLPRWKHYFESKKSGKNFDFAKWEAEWVTAQTGVSPIKPYKDPVDAAIKLIRQTQGISANWMEKDGEIIGTWSPAEVSSTWKEVNWNIPASKLSTLKGILFQYVRGSHRLDICEVTLIADGKEICKITQNGTTGIDNRNNFFKLTVPLGTTGNNTCLIRAKIKSVPGTDSYGNVQMITTE